MKGLGYPTCDIICTCHQITSMVTLNHRHMISIAMHTVCQQILSLKNKPVQTVLNMSP